MPPHGSTTVTFATTWHFPNRQRDNSCGTNYSDILPDVLGNRYAQWFSDACEVASYVVSQLDYLLPTLADMCRPTLRCLQVWKRLPCTPACSRTRAVQQLLQLALSSIKLLHPSSVSWTASPMTLTTWHCRDPVLTVPHATVRRTFLALVFS